VAELPIAGSLCPELVQGVQRAWAEQAARSGVNLTGYDSASSLANRIAWAQAIGLVIGAVLSRFSSKLQHSTECQVLDCVKYAASHGIYVPAEYVCVDEGVSGRKVRRDGLDRMKTILGHKLARVLLVFKVSRLFRVAYRGFQFFQEEVVEEDLRAISVSQGIDTADDRSWKQLAYLHGIMDEMLLTTIADHVRSGIFSLFRAGFVVGALTLGYSAKEVVGAQPTNRGRPRTMPAVDPEVAKLIVQHYEWARDGMPIKQGWRRWVAAHGPCDVRSTTGFMSYNAYRRMLSNPRYTGRWAFGRKRNLWSSKRDYTLQVDQPETEVMLVQSEELRIVSDELFFAVQQRLTGLKTGPRGPKKRKNPQLWDLVTDCFFCATCSTAEKPVRFYQAGANGHGMRCKHFALCPSPTVVRRRDAVLAVCQKLTDLLQEDALLIEQTIAYALAHDAADDASVRDEIAAVEKKIDAIGHKIDDLTELAGEGSDEDRASLKAKVKAAQSVRAAKHAERSRLLKALNGSVASITPDRVRELLADLRQLLQDGAAGTLGGDIIFRTADLFRRLVGGRIWVHVEQRAGRKRTKNVRGTFIPHVMPTVRWQLDDHRNPEQPTPSMVQVWLREPPKCDLLADRVHQLMDIEGRSYRDAAKTLQAEGHKINSGIVWQIYRRHYEMIGQPVPDRPYNDGRPRQSSRNAPT
jgi:DNA invertase Pin-like site-specific DNA recombinase